MEKTIFQKIIDREIPATIVYEDDNFIAILDINPVNIGHTLVIPKHPWVNMYEMPAEDFDHMMQVAHMLGVKIKNTLEADGVNIIMNNDAAAGQVVFHAHVHIIPRYTGDGHEHWHGARGYNEGEAEMIADKIMENY
jgi:histidine triad (HIT) family protein